MAFRVQEGRKFRPLTGDWKNRPDGQNVFQKKTYIRELNPEYVDYQYRMVHG
jgi:hypothetical protein